MDRPSGPLGAATQSSRPTIDTGAPRPAPLNSAARRVPNNNVRHAASSSSLSTQPSITDAQVIALAENAMNNARDEHEKITSQAANAEGLTVPGVTIDLSHKEILNLPEEVVDIIKRDLERCIQFCGAFVAANILSQTSSVSQPIVHTSPKILRMYISSLSQRSKQQLSRVPYMCE